MLHLSRYLVLIACLVFPFLGIAQTTIVNYDFNSATAYPVSPVTTAAGITSSGTSTEAFTSFGGTATGPAAFTANTTAGSSIVLNNSSGTNTKYFQFTQGGASLNTYSSFKIYFQAQRSAAGAQTVTLAYSTDGTSFTNFGTMAPGNGSFVQGLFDLSAVAAINNPSALYFRLYASGASGTGNLRIDNFQIQATAAACTPPSEPTTAASAVSFSNVLCTSMSIAWTNGNGTNRIVVIKAASAVTGTPSDLITYTANPVFGSGSTIAANEYVVYNGTGSSVNVTGLSASTTYHVSVFEYNIGSSCPNYLATAATSSQLTTVCQVPYMTGVLVNSCNGICTEGQNEVVFFYSGDYSIPVAPANIILKYDAVTPTVTTYTDGFTTNSSFIDTLNTRANCGVLFIDAMAAGTIPVNSYFMLLRSNPCYGYNFATFCGYGPIYVLFSTDASWQTSGNFVNDDVPGDLRYFTTDFTGTIPGSVIDYNYEPDQLTTNGDGDGISFASTGGAATSYWNNGDCSPSIDILPIELMYFTGERKDNNVLLKWQTLSEIENDYFTVERTVNGSDFSIVGFVDGAGTSNEPLDYQLTDFESPDEATIYYRLKQTDYNGDYSFSSLVAVSQDSPEDIFWTGNSISVYIKRKSPAELSLFDQSGRNVLTVEVKSEENGRQLIPVGRLAQGIYFVRLVDESRSSVVKFLVK